MTRQGEVSSTAADSEAVGSPAIDVERRGVQSDSNRTWVLGRHQWALLLGSYVGLVAVWTGVGLLLKGPLDDGVVVRTDQRVAEWFAAHRTLDLNTYTVWGSDLADTFIKIGATAVLALVLWLVWRRWLEPLMLIVALALEASVFITVTTLVRRPRPDGGTPRGLSRRFEFSFWAYRGRGRLRRARRHRLLAHEEPMGPCRDRFAMFLDHRGRGPLPDVPGYAFPHRCPRRCRARPRVGGDNRGRSVAY